MSQPLQYHCLKPTEALSPFVDSYWYLSNPNNESKNIVVLPDGKIDLHFYVSQQTPYQVALVGLEKEPSYTTIEPNAVMCAISFKLLAPESILQQSLSAIINQRQILADGYAGVTEADLEAFPTLTEKLNRFLSLQLTSPVDTRKKRMFELIYESKGSISVSEISAATQWSSRQINRYFNQWFGLSLKSYCNILRFRASFDHLKEGKLFPEEDFSDQAHFIKQIKKYSGFTPKQLYKNENDRFVQLSTLK